MEEKTCTHCGTRYPLERFYRDCTREDGRNLWCKHCSDASKNARREAAYLLHPPVRRWHKDSVQHNYFSSIETPLQAYLLGFAAADACVHRNILALEVSVRDREVVELFQRELAPLHIIHDKIARPTGTGGQGGAILRFSFTSRPLIADLSRHGITPHKSHTLTWPSTLPDDLIHAYALGYFDGDGHLTSQVLRSGRRQWHWVITTACLAFAQSFQRIVSTASGISLNGPHPHGERTFRLIKTGNDVMVLDHWLHQSGLGMARKNLALLTAKPE